MVVYDLMNYLCIQFPEGEDNAECFICPLHTCTVCKLKGKVSIQCIRCPNAYHPACLDNTRSLRLHLNLIICHEHLDGRTFTEASHDNFAPKLHDLYATFPEDSPFNERSKVKVSLAFDNNLWDPEE